MNRLRTNEDDKNDDYMIEDDEPLDKLDDAEKEEPSTPSEPPPTTNALQTLEMMEYINQLLEQQRETCQVTLDAKDQLIERLESELERARRPWWQRIFKG